MNFFGSGWNRFKQGGGFGRKGTAEAAPPKIASEPRRIFGNRERADGSASDDASPFARFLEATRGQPANGYGYERYISSHTMQSLSPEERGELLADLAGRPGTYGGVHDNTRECEVASNAFWTVWKHDIAVRKEHLGPLLQHLLDNPSYRSAGYLDEQVGQLMKLIRSAIQQGAYLSSADCEALAAMAAAIRSGSSYRKAETKKMLARAKRIEKLAGVEASATEFLMSRCEGADNPHAIRPAPHANAAFWANLLAEVAAALDEIRRATKGGTAPAWARSAGAFEAEWPACGDVVPRLADWKAGDRPVAALKNDNGKRNGWSNPDAYRRLPDDIALAAAHSRFIWNSDQIPGLEVLADLENPDWTGLAEHLITQRRAPRSTKAWQRQALALCAPLGLATVEARLHDWMALFHSPALGREAYTRLVNGERFVAAMARLEKAHPDWPERHAGELRKLGRAVAICVASGPGHTLAPDFHPRLLRLDDHVYKNRSATTGVLGLLNPSYRSEDGRGTYQTLSTWMRLSVENEDFLRGAVWLAALLPDRARAITALELTALAAGTYTTTGDDGMRSKVIANAAIATLIDMGGPDIDAAVLRLSKGVEHQTVRAPLIAYLEGTG